MNNEYKLTVEILDNEYWWGGCVSDGPVMPYGRDTVFLRNMTTNPTVNQATPFLASSLGRYVWCDSGFDFTISAGVIDIKSIKAEPSLYEGYETLKGAYLNASKTHFAASGKAPNRLFFEKPQYNTWIELMYNQNQGDIIKYAESIVDSGMPQGLLMIDCGWSEYYGNWKFHSGRFPDPKSMINQLHQMGFTVMLWICPFVSADSVEYRYLRDNGFLVCDKNGDPAIKKWWDGFSAVLDFTNPKAIKWFKTETEYLVNEYGIDGFKFDAGDAMFYSDENDVTHAPTDANGQSEMWARFGLNYDFNEYRACFKCGGEALAQRLADKQHSWDNFGLGALIPSALAQGIAGYAYTCPDMVGGGDYLNFMANADKLDQELFVRYAQCSALMPMIQFSAAPWRVLNSMNFEKCKFAAWLHTKFADTIYDLVENSKITGEPIIRYMDYVFPGQNLEQITNQFMLGDKIMVAPVLVKGASIREIVIPSGLWEGKDGEIIEGPCRISVNVDMDSLPFYKLTQ